jgi:hypothetical protein
MARFYVSLDNYVEVEADNEDDAAAKAPAAVIAYLQGDGIAEFVVEEEDGFLS